MPAHLLIIDARFYEDIAEELVAGAARVLAAAGASHERLSVPGVLEIPPALSMALASPHGAPSRFDGVVLLGCVIRGETSHYDIVANESARAVMDLAVAHELALGNGILTVETSAQAWARAQRAEKDKGGAAARAALDMIAVKERILGRLA